MGCSSSAVSPHHDNPAKESNKQTDIFKVQKNGTANNHSSSNNQSPKSKDVSLNSKDQQVDKNGNKLNVLAQTPVPKSVAFDVNFDDDIGDGLKSFKKRPPRLQTLEPLNTPKLTAEQLQEKQRIADEKREKLKQRKISTYQKSSRRMRELNKAREFEESLLVKQDNNEELDSMMQAELRREQHLLQVKDKQRLREERAKRTKERAKQAHNLEDDVVIEKDEEFNTQSDDAWLGIPDKTGCEEEYGLQKRAGQMRPTVSSTTIDSYDAAFMRSSSDTHVHSVHSVQENVHINNEDSFYS